jgi:Ca2+/H+ antiporter, TMEM165/GDT1 family
MEALLLSTAVVALAEIGDKTQLLSLLLATRFRAPWTIVAGIGVATIANHALASAAGAWLLRTLGPDIMRWALAASFLLMAIWTMIPDSAPEQSASKPRFGVFLTTALTFFLVEMGDKTQVATVALAARFEPWFAIVIGTTLGMMLANVPVVFAGEALLRRVPFKTIRIIAAAGFVALGLYVFAFGAGSPSPL